MAWPPNVSDGQIVAASHINAIKDSVASWGGAVAANGYGLTGVGTLTATTIEKLAGGSMFIKASTADGGDGPLIFQNSNGGGWNKYLRLANDGSLQIINSAYSAQLFSWHDNGILQFYTQAWNGAHLVMGLYHIWVDGSGRLRIKNGAPASDTDGTVVGTQT